MNATIEKFGYPATLIRDYRHWVVLLRPKQATLGALVLACKEEATAWGDVSEAATAELAPIVRDIEATLIRLFEYKKINYLMLMMVDPHVHYHVIPRYDAPRRAVDGDFIDPGWPGVPDLGYATELSEPQFLALHAFIKDAWPLT